MSPRKELYDFGRLVFLLLAMFAANMVRLDYVQNLDKGSITYSVWFYLMASAIDGMGAFIIASCPGYRIKWASRPIAFCFAGSCFLHFFAFTAHRFPAAQIEFDVIYEQISYYVLILEFLFLAVGGYGSLRRHRSAVNADYNVWHTDSSPDGVHSRIDSHQE